MSINRIIFSLGDGIDTVTGEHKGRGIITIKDQEPSKDQKPEVKSEINHIASGDTKYEVSVICDYRDLYQALNLKSILSTETGQASLSIEASLIKKAKISTGNVCLLIKGQKITHTKVIPSNISVDQKHIDTLVNHREIFCHANGTGYITQVNYGAEIYVLINLSNTEREDALEFKHTLETRLAKQALIKTKIQIEQHISVKQRISDINIQYSGVEMGLPSVASSIDELLSFIDEFNKAKTLGAPISHLNEHYITIIQIREAKELHAQMKLITSLLSDFDKTNNNLKTIIPNLEKIILGIKHFSIKDAPIDRLTEFLDVANHHKKLIESLTLAINLHKTDLTYLPRNITGELLISIPKPTKKESKEDLVISADFHERQYFIKNQLNYILENCSKKVKEIEDEIDAFKRQVSAVIIKVKSTEDHFYLTLPQEGAKIRWEIENTEEKNGLEYFDIHTKDKSEFNASFVPKHRRIYHGYERKMDVPATHQVRIKPNNSKAKYTLTGSVIGWQALDTNIARISTNLTFKNYVSLKEKEPSKKSILFEFKNEEIRKFNQQLLDDTVSDEESAENVSTPTIKLLSPFFSDSTADSTESHTATTTVLTPTKKEVSKK